MFKFGFKLLCIICGIFIFATGTSLISPKPAIAGAPDKILIGTTVSESGYMAEDSIPSFKGRKLAVDLVNKDGGLFLSKWFIR